MERAINHISDDTGRIALLEVKTRIGGSEILPTNQTTITRYQYNNHLGSACLELNENAEVLSYEEFHPFGSTSYSMHSNDSEVSLKRYKYNGKERDNESSLDYYGARYYASWLCRFVSVDPLKDNYSFQNPFAYAANRPITLTDVNGEGPGGGDEEDPPPIDSDLKGSPEYEKSNDPNKQKHAVKKGDTLSALAEKYGTTVDALVKNNKISDPDKIYVGQELSIDNIQTIFRFSINKEGLPENQASIAKNIESIVQEKLDASENTNMSTIMTTVSIALERISNQIKNADGANFVEGVGKIADIMGLLFSLEKATNENFSMQDRTEGSIESILTSVSLISTSSLAAVPAAVYSVAAYNKEATIELNVKMQKAYRYNADNFNNTSYGQNAVEHYRK